MSLRIILAASAVLAFAAPAIAQDAPAAPPAAEAPSAAEVAMEARGEAFKARMELMQGELETAITGAGSDQARGMADVDAILARYQPDIDSFIADFETFIDAEAAAETDEAKRAEMSAAKMGVRAALSGIPGQIRAGAQAALSAQATAPAAPAAAQ
ncbi:translation initiation factor IF-2 [Brevundimonas sp.]|uniref:translation initiation factor IF-2 n=1 Tax=Brevundimonas sp. TaxID=1871086 RepID=UPI002D25A484|nr:translation initiation factor IF-2 [Brevundimonas sp.]HYD26414.1 translation initiation factor IF-2 [Brevundimonas sp.]